MQWSLIAVFHIVNTFFGAFCASAENGTGQISSVFEAFGYSPACVASALTSCELSSKKEHSIDFLDSILNQKMKSERENSGLLVQSLLQEMKSERENSGLLVQSLLQEMKSERENSGLLVQSLLQEMKSERENSGLLVQSLLQEMKSERENSGSVIKSLFQEMKLEREDLKNKFKFFEILPDYLKNITLRISNLEANHQEAKSDRENISNSLKDFQLLQQEMKSEQVNVTNLFSDMKTFLQEVKTERNNDSAITVDNSKTLAEIMAALEKINPKKNCAELQVKKELSGGVQTVYPYGIYNFTEVVVYCDQVTDGGGWTTIQRRSPLPVRENFSRTWSEYVTGFGDPNGEFWLGLDNIHALTSSAQMKLRVDLEDWDGAKAWAQYEDFYVGDATSKYELRIGGFSGNAGDGMTIPVDPSRNLNGMKFSAYDRDNDLHIGENCAERHRGGWWYNICHAAHLNGLPIEGKDPIDIGILWDTFRPRGNSLKKASMKIRPVSHKL